MPNEIENGMGGLQWCGDRRHVRPSRRDFLYVGMVGGLGLSLGNYLGMTGRTALAEQKNYESKEGPAKSVIHIFMPGGMAAQESFDPKPLAPIEYRGPLGTVQTKLTGEVFMELAPLTRLPKLRELVLVRERPLDLSPLAEAPQLHEVKVAWLSGPPSFSGSTHGRRSPPYTSPALP